LYLYDFLCKFIVKTTEHTVASYESSDCRWKFLTVYTLKGHVKGKNYPTNHIHRTKNNNNNRTLGHQRNVISLCCLLQNWLVSWVCPYLTLFFDFEKRVSYRNVDRENVTRAKMFLEYLFCLIYELTIAINLSFNFNFL
jgi:hypothetical protein